MCVQVYIHAYINYVHRCVYVHTYKVYKIYAHKHMSMETAPLNVTNKDLVVLHLSRGVYVL